MNGTTDQGWHTEPEWNRYGYRTDAVLDGDDAYFPVPRGSIAGDVYRLWREIQP